MSVSVMPAVRIGGSVAAVVKQEVVSRERGLQGLMSVRSPMPATRNPDHYYDLSQDSEQC